MRLYISSCNKFSFLESRGTIFMFYKYVYYYNFLFIVKEVKTHIKIIETALDNLNIGLYYKFTPNPFIRLHLVRYC